MTMTTSPEAFAELISQITARIEGAPLDQTLERRLNTDFPITGREIAAIEQACTDAIAAGWMCAREAGGIKYGRVIPAGPKTHGFSVDVVEMPPLAGPHHRHPNGEIDLILPLSPNAEFDGHGAGWLVYGPGSAHHPTVTNGPARILYLLPGGAIEFTRR